MSKKLIFFDIDNTLVYHDIHKSFVPEPTKQAVRLLKDNGHEVLFATGRSRIHTVRWARELDIESSGLFNNGSYAVYKGDELFGDRLSQQLTNDIYRYLLSDRVCIFGAAEDCMYVYNASPDTISYLEGEAERTGMVKPFPATLPPLLALTVYGLDGNWTGQEELIKNFPEVYFCDGRAEIVNRGVSKGKSMLLVAERLGFSAKDIIAVGDEMNDIEMIRYAGIGIAVGNGRNELKAVADITTDDISKGGIYKAFKGIGVI